MSVRARQTKPTPKIPVKTEKVKAQISALWLRSIGDEIQVLAEIDGCWRKICSETWPGPFSVICEARSFADKPYDDLIESFREADKHYRERMRDKFLDQ